MSRHLLNLNIYANHYFRSPSAFWHSHPSVIGFTPATEGERRLAPMLGKVQKVCRLIPGSRFDIYVKEGELALTLHWTPRADADQNFGEHRFTVDAAGAKETAGTRETAGSNHSKVNLGETPCEPLKAATAAPEAKHAQKPGLIRQITDYLTSCYYFRFNVLTEQTEYAPRPALDPAEQLAPFARVDERMVNTLTIEVQEQGIDGWNRDIKRFVHSKRVADYHPFLNYMQTLPEWDGQDRVSALAARVSDDPVWQNGFHRWLLGMTAQWMDFSPTRHANSVAPLLVSAEQGWGKSTFCRLLLPEVLTPYYTDSFDLAAPAACEQKLAAFGLINIDEFDRLPAAKMPLLKNLMQMSALNIRKAYRQSHSSLHRIASFIGTSNVDTLLTDHSGSRRFLCVKLTHPIDTLTPINHAQLYAQLKAELERGERHWFTKDEEADIRRNNALFYRHVPEEELFHSVFRFATPDDSEADIRQLSATQIYEALKQAHPAAMRGLTAYGLSRVLPQLGERVHTMRGNVYRVVMV